MHPYQGRLFSTDITHHHGHVHATVDAIFVGHQAEGTVHGGQFALADAFDGLLVAQPVVDQVGDGADLDAVAFGEHF